MRTRKGLRGGAAIIAMSIAVTSCGAPGLPAFPNLSGASEPLTPAQQALVDANKRFNQTIGEGAVIGALAGAGLGAVVGGNNRLAAAAIGAAAGGLIGGSAGYLVARKNYEQAKTEDNLRKSIAEARADTEAYSRSADASRQVAADARERIASLNAQYRAKTITAADYRNKMASFKDSDMIMEKQIAAMQSESEALRADASSAQASDQTQLITAARQIDTAKMKMQRNRDSLEKALSDVPAG